MEKPVRDVLWTGVRFSAPPSCKPKGERFLERSPSLMGTAGCGVHPLSAHGHLASRRSGVIDRSAQQRPRERSGRSVTKKGSLPEMAGIEESTKAHPRMALSVSQGRRRCPAAWSVRLLASRLWDCGHFERATAKSPEELLELLVRERVPHAPSDE